MLNKDFLLSSGWESHGEERRGEEGGSSEKSSNVKASLDRRLLWLHCTTQLSMSWRRIGFGAKKLNSPFPDVFPPHLLQGCESSLLYLRTISLHNRNQESLGCYLVRFPTDTKWVGEPDLEVLPGWELILEQTLPRRFFSPVTFRMCSSQSKNTNILLRANI